VKSDRDTIAEVNSIPKRDLASPKKENHHDNVSTRDRSGLKVLYRAAFTVYGAYKSDSPLVESGLLGPVRLLRQPRMKQ
jgi:hypothetical protein